MIVNSVLACGERNHEIVDVPRVNLIDINKIVKWVSGCIRFNDHSGNVERFTGDFLMFQSWR